MQVDDNVKRIIGIRYISCNEGILRVITTNGVKFSLSLSFDTLTQADALRGLTPEQISMYVQEPDRLTL